MTSLDAQTRYYYDGWKIAETRVGASATTYYQQFIHGTQYIDEVVMVRAIDKGDLYVHQDANWNVIGTTDLAASIVERNVYTPYGQLTVNQETSYGDRDGDGDVDATDKGTPGTTCTGTVTGACRILDLDFDGDYDSTDATKFDALTQGIARHPGRTTTATNQPFAHQGLLFEPEISSYQNRARQYVPSNRRFIQRDPYAFLRNTFLTERLYRDGADLFALEDGNPISRLDPMGTEAGKCTTPGDVFETAWQEWFCIPNDGSIGCSNSMLGQRQKNDTATLLSSNCDAGAGCNACAANLFDGKFTWQVDNNGTLGSGCFKLGKIGCRSKYKGAIKLCCCVS